MESELKFNNQGQTIAIKRYGDPQNPKMLAIHGWLDNANSFLPLAKELEDYCIYAIDLPGHGLSSHLPAYATYHFIDGVTLVHQLIDKLFDSPPTLLGHSLGGCISSLAACSLGNKIQTVIVLDALGPLVCQEEKAYSQYLSFIEKQSLFDSKTKRISYYPNKEMAALMRAKSGYLAKEEAMVLCQRALKKNESGYFFGHDRKLLLPSALKMTNNMVINFLNALASPCLFLEASNGFVYDKKAMKLRLRAVKSITHQVVKGGHHFHMEHPKETASLIRHFLNT